MHRDGVDIVGVLPRDISATRRWLTASQAVADIHALLGMAPAG